MTNIKVITVNPKKIKKNILKPDTNIIIIQEKINNKHCPISGWLISNATEIKRSKKEYKYLL